MKRFTKNPDGDNFNLELDPDQWLSFNDDPCRGMGPMFTADDASGETALRAMLDREIVWLVLRGDHRDAYEKAVAERGIQSCLRYYGCIAITIGTSLLPITPAAKRGLSFLLAMPLGAVGVVYWLKGRE